MEVAGSRCLSAHAKAQSRKGSLHFFAPLRLGVSLFVLQIVPANGFDPEDKIDTVAAQRRGFNAAEEQRKLRLAFELDGVAREPRDLRRRILRQFREDASRRWIVEQLMRRVGARIGANPVRETLPRRRQVRSASEECVWVQLQIALDDSAPVRRGPILEGRLAVERAT